MTNPFTIATLTAFLIPVSVPPVATAPPPVEIPVIKFEKTWKCPDCTPNEKYVLAELQKRTKISDRNALATILGNIKQESNFCLLYTSPSPRDRTRSRMPSSA